MLRILVFDEPFSVKLRLEGELTDRTTPQLTQRWAEVRSRLRNRKAILDLGDVVNVDQSGRDVLTWLTEAGVRIGYAHPVLRSFMDELARRRSAARFAFWRRMHVGQRAASVVYRLVQSVCSMLPPRLRPCGCRPD